MSKDLRTYASRRNYLIKAVEKRRHLVRGLLHYFAGEQCNRCGYAQSNAGLVFHHIYPPDKKFKLSSSNEHSWEKILEEFSKCIYLCRNCHAELHENKWQIDEIM